MINTNLPEIRIPSECLDGVKKEFEGLTDRQLLKAVELMVKPSDMLDRQTLIAILTSQDYTADEVRDQLAVNMPLHDGKPTNLKKLL